MDVLPLHWQLKSNERGVSLAKTLSNMGLYNMDSITDETLAEAATVLTPHSNSAQTLKVTPPPPPPSPPPKKQNLHYVVGPGDLEKAHSAREDETALPQGRSAYLSLFDDVLYVRRNVQQR